MKKASQPRKLKFLERLEIGGRLGNGDSCLADEAKRYGLTPSELKRELYIGRQGARSG